jgi:hypothetical protein
MYRVLRLAIVALIICILLGTGAALAFKPSETGVGLPQTVWSERGIKGSVSGTVVTSLDQTTGISGAYVALVNPINPNIEYMNTTSDANGNFIFTGVYATYSSTLSKGPDGKIGTFQQGQNAYMIYVNNSSLGEGYSSSFGIDTNQTSTTIGDVVIYAGTPAIASPSPTATPQPTQTTTPSPPSPTTTVTPTDTPVPAGNSSILTLLITAAIVILVIAAVAVYFLYLRKK